jgi:integrase
VLHQPLGEMTGLKRVQRRQRIPVVLSREEVKAILEQMTGVVRLMAELIYGSGLRVNECMTLRVKDINFSGGVLNVRSGKGGKDRTTLPPERLHAPIKQQLLRVAEQHKHDLSHGAELRSLSPVHNLFFGLNPVAILFGATHTPHPQR